MIARISREFMFPAAIHHEGSFTINSYELVLHMDVTTENIREQNIALDRIKFLIDVCLTSCIFVDVKDCKAIDLYSKAGITVCPLPDEPYDQVIAAVLISKFNIITENHLMINEIEIRSQLCDDVCFYVSTDEEADFQNLQNVWWTENNPGISVTTKKAKREKVVDMKKEPIEWNIVGLGWKDESKKCDKGEIVYIPMDK